MTVPATTRKAGLFTGTGAVSNYPFTFKIFSTADIQVRVTDTSGVETVLSSGYSTAMNADQGATPGGSITLTSPLALNYTLAILGALPFDQTLALPGGGNFNPVAIENALDRTVEQIQQLSETSSRGLTFPAGDTAPTQLPSKAARLGMLFGFDAVTGAITMVAAAFQSAVSLALSLASSVGSSLVGFIQSGTGSVPTDLQTKTRQGFLTPEDKGAVGDGIADDTTALTNWAATGGVLTGGIGKTYLITAEIPVMSNTIIDLRGSTVKATTRIRSYFYGLNKTNVKVLYGTFDLGQPVLATYTAADYAAVVYYNSQYNTGCYFEACSDIEVADNEFKNLYTNSLLFHNVSGNVTITRNRFTSPVQAQKVKAEHISGITCAASFDIYDNRFISVAPSSADFGVVATVFSGTSGRVDIHHNETDYCGRNGVGTHPLSPFSFYADCSHGSVHHNTMTNCLYGAVRLTSIWNALVHHNYMKLASIGDTIFALVSIESGGYATTIDNCKNIDVHNNILEANTTGYGVTASAGSWGSPLTNIKIHHNTQIGMRFAFTHQGVCDGLYYTDNEAYGANGNAIALGLYPGAVDSHGITQATSAIRNIEILRNRNHSTGAASAYEPCFMDLTGYTGTVGSIRIEDNTNESDALAATAGFRLRGTAVGTPAATQGSIKIKNNIANNYAIGVQVWTWYKATVLDNQTPNCTSPYDVGSGVNTVVKTGNTYTVGGRLSGSNVLVAGTVTVNTTEAQTGDTILLTRTVTGGTVGHLSIGTITGSTSFVINSSSATDTSTISWEIRH